MNIVIRNIKTGVCTVPTVDPTVERNKLALISCIELTLMRSGNTNYQLILSKLDTLYDAGITDCYDHPDYLRIILKEVYEDNYRSIVNEIKMCLDDLIVEKDIAAFMEVMEKEYR